jgi:hypothetical protein
VVVEKLTDLGVSATDVKKLKEAGYYTIEALFMRPKKARPHRGGQSTLTFEDLQTDSASCAPRLGAPLTRT